MASVSQAHGSDLMLWYNSPAKNTLGEAMPIGNGRMGGLVFGGVPTERIVLDEDSLWTGDENPSGNYDTMGAYQMLADLSIALPDQQVVTNYRRDLDIGDAITHVRSQMNGINYSREAFCSHPDQVMVVRLTASKPAAYTGTITLTDAHPGQVAAQNSHITEWGALNNGLKYEMQLLVLNDGGTARADGGTVAFKGCNSVTLLFAAGTDYVMDYHRNWRGEDPHGAVTARIQAAAAKSYDALKAAHVKDYRSLFDRVALDLGKGPADREAMPTDQRKAADVKGDDPELDRLLFQYGRYLLISCSRAGGLPANLQGLWNDSNSPPWDSDYHSNINVQMNYWLTEPTDMPECAMPFLDLIKSQLEPWRKATAAAPEFKLPSGETHGWALRTSHNIYGGMGWRWNNMANAWYCQHLWEHYAFGGDKAYLRDFAYPILKETSEFWGERLKALPDGQLVVPNGWSPEHGPTEDGVTYDQEILWDLFSNTIDAADALGIDTAFRDALTAKRDKLLKPKIGKWGQLQEWMEDIDDPNDHHRHTSHLFAVYPGREISPSTTPALADAAKVSLKARGTTDDSNREWAFAWRSALWARLKDGDNAHNMIRLFLFQGSLPNLIGNHPPPQWDGSFGVAAGMAEMLMQSQTGQIELLPALPSVWPTGSVTGLRARGAFDVDIIWKDGKLTGAVIRSRIGNLCHLSYAGKTVDFNTKAGQAYRFDGTLKKL
jgi:alpha-L-fucosidase 2